MTRFASKIVKKEEKYIVFFLQLIKFIELNHKSWYLYKENIKRSFKSSKTDGFKTIIRKLNQLVWQLTQRTVF